MKNFFKEFKAFISRGNILDMAVGVIIGAAFGKIVTSLVNDIIMPLITWAFGAESLADLSVPLRTDADGVVTLAWNYGNFIQSIIDFLIIAFCIFIIIKLVMKSQQVFKNSYQELKYTRPTKEQKKLLQDRGIDLKDKKAVHAALKALADEEKKKAAEAVVKKETQEEILNDIRELLKNMAKNEKNDTVDEIIENKENDKK